MALVLTPRPEVFKEHEVMISCLRHQDWEKLIETIDICRKNKEDSDEYTRLLSYALHIAALNDQEEIFDKILERMEEIQFLFPQRVMFNGYLEYTHLNLDSFDEIIYVTENPKYMERIHLKLGLGVSEWKPRKYKVKGNFFVTTMSDVCRSILAGHNAMVKFYFEHGYVFKEDLSPEYEIRWSYQDRHYDMEINEPIEAALLSGDEDIVRYIAEKIPSIKWTDNLRQIIVHSSEKIVKVLEEILPDQLQNISFEEIVIGHNKALFEFYLKSGSMCHMNLDDFSDSRRVWFHSLKGVAHDYADFYRFALEKTKEETDKHFIRECMLYEILNEVSDDLEKRDEIIKLFNADRGKKVEDYTRCLYHLFTRIQSLYLMEKMNDIKRSDAEWVPLGINVYDPVWEEFGTIPHLDRSELTSLVDTFEPVEIQAKADWLTKLIIDSRSEKIIKKAIKHGFISSANSLSLYNYMQDKEIYPENIQVYIISLAGDMDLKGRYTMGLKEMGEKNV